jgi:hypothetical protein
MGAVGNESLELGQKQLPCWLVGVPRIDWFSRELTMLEVRVGRWCCWGQGTLICKSERTRRKWALMGWGGGVRDAPREKEEGGVCGGGECSTRG